MPIRIVSDSNIPFVKEFFSEYGIVDLIPGHEIEQSAIRDADALFVRSVTKIDKKLLHGTSVQFVGSATAGLDHVDVPYLTESGISLFNAPGANAESVVEYVLSALFVIASKISYPILTKTLGVVGCGNVGGRLAERARNLGMRVLENDPPLQREAEKTGQNHAYVPLEYILKQSDVISLHVPLSASGRDATLGLVSRKELELMGPQTWLVNTARGGVVEEKALLGEAENGIQRQLIVDVWEHEPCPDSRLQRRTSIATPHIAGYSRDAKKNATKMIWESFRAHFNLKDLTAVSFQNRTKQQLLQAPKANPIHHRVDYIHQILEQMYRIERDHERMAEIPESPEAVRAESFRELRWNYPARFSFGGYVLTDQRLDSGMAQCLERGLGIRVARQIAA